MGNKSICDPSWLAWCFGLSSFRGWAKVNCKIDAKLVDLGKLLLEVFFDRNVRIISFVITRNYMYEQRLERIVKTSAHIAPRKFHSSSTMMPKT